MNRLRQALRLLGLRGRLWVLIDLLDRVSRHVYLQRGGQFISIHELIFGSPDQPPARPGEPGSPCEDRPDWPDPWQ